MHSIATELFLQLPRKNLENNSPMYTSKIATIPKGKHLLPGGRGGGGGGGGFFFSLRAVPMIKMENILCYMIFVANIFPYAYA